MTLDDGWRTPSGSGAPTYAPAVNSRPRLGISDLILQLWRAKWLMMLVFFPIFILGLVAAFMLPVSYESSSRIKVSLGTEDVFNPIVGPGTGAVPEPEQVVEAEIELMQSPVIAERVLEKIGIERLFPKLVKEMEEATDEEAYVLREDAIRAIQREFAAWAPPKNPVVRTTFKAKDPIVSADTLNAMIDTYLEYRAELFINDTTGTLTNQRLTAEIKLAEADEAIQNFLINNDIGDFDTEKSSIASLYANVTDQLLQVQAALSEARGRLDRVQAQLETTNPTIDLFIESTAQQSLQNLEIEREQLLAKYRSDSLPVQAKDAEIAKVREFLSTQDTPKGTTRTGPNEVYLELQSRQTNLEAEVQALQQRARELQRQKSGIERRQRALNNIEPQYQELLREQAIQENQVRGLAIREQDERLKQDILRASFDNIQILERARPPARGSSFRRVVAAVSLLFAGFTALMAGLLRAYTLDSFSTASSLGRSVGLPVIASVPRVA